MPLSWNEIRNRALEFSKRWENETSEDAEAKPFWIEFLNIYGIDRKRVASFEEPVKKLGDQQGYIDLFWKGVLLVEHKSRGKNLDKAYTQALDYFPGIKERDLPKYVLVSDFERFRLYDLELPSPQPSPRTRGEGAGLPSPHPVGRGGSAAEGEGQYVEFKLADLHKHIKHFAFIAGYRTQTIAPQNPVNIKAAERMGKLHDALKAAGYAGHPLEVLLVRLLFCLFAEDTGIFQPANAFRMWIEERTAADGSDLGAQLAQLFQVLNTAEDKRSKNLDEQIAAFPYVNGKLFEEMLPIASFDLAMREALLDCCALDWSAISPAIFGALFQSIMDTRVRRNIGAHYTSEENILKLIQPLFLDQLWEEFKRVKGNKNKLFEFHKKLRTLTFFDPACGCGNFLVIAYRELRKLELDVLRAVHEGPGSRFLDIHQQISVDVDQFYGIEIEEFPAQIAQVALWLMDHQMNVRVSEEFGMYFARIPLKTSPHIVHGNALTLDWNEVLPAERASYVFGNPPFIGKHYQSKQQKAELVAVFSGVKSASDLDYVAAWYMKAARYMTSPHPNPLPACGASEQEKNPLPTSGERVPKAGEGQAHRRDPVLEEKLKTYARELRASATDAEQRIWYLLRNRNFFGFKFRRQHPLAGYILDFYCADAGLAIELDGGQHGEQAAYDARREATLQQHGIRILRFWNNDVLLNTEAVLAKIADALPLTPTLSPQAGRGSMDESRDVTDTLSPRVGRWQGEGRCCAAFVSTNSITQGEQVSILWGELLNKYHLKIHFAHRTFKWSNEASGKAAVHCVIIGFAPFDCAEKKLFVYDDVNGEAHELPVNNISPYLAPGPDTIITKRKTPLANVPIMRCGNKPSDGGHLLLTDTEREELLAKEPASASYIRRFIGSEEFINNISRWCLWLVDCNPKDLRTMPKVMERIERVREFRAASTAEPTRRAAETPAQFFFISQPKVDYILIPEVSSVRQFCLGGYLTT